MQDSVSKGRDKWVGGSDIPIIMGISEFKDRFTLLQEKAKLKPMEVVSNKYIDYGNALEPKIRAYINRGRKDKFKEGKHTVERDVIGFRCHTDGENEDTILEIKTTGGNYDKKVYLVQLLFYMMVTEKPNGMLAIYTRPEDMNEDFDKNRLTVECISIDNYTELCDEIMRAVDLFTEHLARIKDNPFLSEEDLMPKELVEISQKAIALDMALADLKKQEKAVKAFKQELYDNMMAYGIKSWKTNGGFTVTRVDATEAETYTEEEFDEKAFKAEHPRVYNKYVRAVEKKKSGRAGYALITAPREKK